MSRNYVPGGVFEAFSTVSVCVCEVSPALVIQTPAVISDYRGMIPSVRGAVQPLEFQGKAGVRSVHRERQMASGGCSEPPGAVLCFLSVCNHRSHGSVPRIRQLFCRPEVIKLTSSSHR